MTLNGLLHRRRSVRHFDENAGISADTVRECLQLAPSSSNMQLYEFYHITDTALLARLSEACLSQNSAKTARQMVVFVTRQDLHKQRAAALLELERENTRRNSPSEKQAKYLKNWENYYGKLLPFLYARYCGLFTPLRKLVAYALRLKRPMMTYVGEGDMRVAVHKSCALAAQTFMLAMAEKGYDTCPLEGLDPGLVKKILNLPRGAEINMIAACGIRRADGKGIWGERVRLPFENVYRRL
ncbi:nitroreductase family protein [Neisseria chenwenguii]|uniref:Nitroreductase family protein n=1 Tax=Neisseria chenwenguii TaxID=1853278 RepID=A0A220S1Q4_9NEIS|nr:nitroreductase family protein [Neisseria chenwenguii]ASK27404.1 nitroreductase family protein [Neisseria chenwenguii]ROV56924.1 nitroreductase family protein [Neisseria chenwenguii]